MRRFLATGLAILLFGLIAVKLSNRWREERRDRRIAILVDWSEVHDWTARQGLADDFLLERLHRAGFTSILIGANTIQDYLWDGLTSDRSGIDFSARPLAENVRQQLVDRGVAGTRLTQVNGVFRLTSSVGNWDRLKDVEIGFNVNLLLKAQKAGFHLILRLNNDPWLPKESLFSELERIRSSNSDIGFLLNTDDIPGGPDALPAWSAFLASSQSLGLLFEFHPAKSALKLAYKTPARTFRAHTIASNELKDLSDGQQMSRWRRAVEERSCRFLLFHVPPNDSFPDFCERISSVRKEFLNRGWDMGWPQPRPTWSTPSFLQREVNAILALIVAIVVPFIVLRRSLPKRPWPAFVQITVLTLLGACAVAALAENPLTRVEILPFRGSKMAFGLGWIGTFLTLYSGKEIKEQLLQQVRRLDILMGCALVGVVVYVLIRMGNVSAGWKVAWEQGLRDRMEDILIARPRFKEFAVGYPLLILGLHLKRVDPVKSFWREGRFWIGVGMIGPISMINTFCHIHSPLYLAFWRSLNGFFFGTLFGLILLIFRKLREKWS